MPYCPECEYEYVEGVIRCPDCDVELVAQLEPETEADCGPEPAVTEDFVPVFAGKDAAEARIVKSILLDAGIPVLDKLEFGHYYASAGLSSFHPHLSELDQFALSVPESRLYEAEDIINEALRAGEQMRDDQPP